MVSIKHGNIFMYSVFIFNIKLKNDIQYSLHLNVYLAPPTRYQVTL